MVSPIDVGYPRLNSVGWESHSGPGRGSEWNASARVEIGPGGLLMDQGEFGTDRTRRVSKPGIVDPAVAAEQPNDTLIDYRARICPMSTQSLHLVDVRLSIARTRAVPTNVSQKHVASPILILTALVGEDRTALPFSMTRGWTSIVGCPA